MAHAARTDFVAVTDAAGAFLLEVVPPGEYLLMANQREVITDFFILDLNEVLDLGIIEYP